MRTKEALKNCKKALAIVLRHDSPYKSCAMTGILPSGMSFEDYWLFVRKQMHSELFKSVRSSKLVEEAKTDETTTTTEEEKETTTGEVTKTTTAENATFTMAEKWMFPGFIVFALFGSIVEPEIRYYQSHLIMTKPRRNGDINETAGTPDNNNNKNKMKRHKGQVMGDSGSGNKLTVSQESRRLQWSSPS